MVGNVSKGVGDILKTKPKGSNNDTEQRCQSGHRLVTMVIIRLLNISMNDYIQIKNNNEFK